MKTIIKLSVFTVAIFSFSILSAQAWEEQAKGLFEGNYSLEAISVVDENIVWVLAYNVINFNSQNIVIEVLKTEDGGENWESIKIEEISGSVGFDIEAFDSQSAFITTCSVANSNQCTIFKTEDGGDTWEEKFNNTAAGRWIVFFNDTDGLVLNGRQNATTIDGGETWQLVNSNSIPPFMVGEDIPGFYTKNKSVEVIGDHVWFGTNMGRIYRSKDKGFSWEVFNTSLSIDNSISSIAFRDSLNGIAVAADSYDSPFSITNDGGETWNTLISYPGLAIKHLEYVPGTERFLIGTSGNTGSSFNRVSAYSNDFGVNWTVIDNVTPSGFYKFIPFGPIKFISPNVGWMIRSDLRFSSDTPVYKWQSDKPVSAVDIKNEYEVSVFPNPAVENISLASSKDIKAYSLFTIEGKLIQHNQLDLTETEINVEQLDPGVFLLELLFIDNTTYTQEVIIVD